MVESVKKYSDGRVKVNKDYSPDEIKNGMTETVIFKGEVKWDKLYLLRQLEYYNREKSSEFVWPLVQVRLDQRGDEVMTEYVMMGHLLNDEGWIMFGHVDINPLPKKTKYFVKGVCYWPSCQWAKSYFEKLRKYLYIFESDDVRYTARAGRPVKPWNLVASKMIVDGGRTPEAREKAYDYWCGEDNENISERRRNKYTRSKFNKAMKRREKKKDIIET